jgi:trk system potassium uptake protein TrkH
MLLIKGHKIINFKPAQVVVLGFASVILVGALLLSLPISTQLGHIDFVNAFFTATSAVCVTGLVVVDTGTHFTVFGQLVILALIQIGGLGFMTSATFLFLLVGKRITLRERLVIQESLGQYSIQGLVKLIRYILMTTFIIEGIGALLISLRLKSLMPLDKAVYYGVFHAVSAFCNAGFDIFGGFLSLTSFTGDVLMNIVFSSLFVFGGLGFTVINEIYQKRSLKRLSLHSRLVIMITFLLIVIGFIVIFILEKDNPGTLANLSTKDKIIASYFQAVTPRTAGFNTINIRDMRPATLFFIIILMFIGASPGSTGGGIKTITFGALAIAIVSIIRGREEVNIMGKRIPQDVINRALVVTGVSVVFVSVTAFVLVATNTHGYDFIDLLFEAVSAFGTVGLSTGVTRDLSSLSQIFIIITMFAGRVGPLSLALALSGRTKKSGIRYPEEKIIIG